MNKKNKTDINKLKNKAMRYCAMQERAIADLKRKLIDWGADQKQSELIINEMIKEHFIDEKRYVAAYVSGKHRLNKWGRFLIMQGLQQKQIPHTLIEEALGDLDYQEYIATLRSIMLKKKQSLPEGLTDYEKKAKLIRYAASRGYENELIYSICDKILDH